MLKIPTTPKTKQAGHADVILIFLMVLCFPVAFIKLTSLYQISHQQLLAGLLREWRPGWQGPYLRKQQQIKYLGQSWPVPPRLDFGQPEGITAWAPATCKVLAHMEVEPSWQKHCPY